MELERKVTLTNPEGLHIRVGVKLVEESRKFKSEVYLSNEETTVNSKDIIDILTLGAVAGTVLTLKAVGEDAEEALSHLVALFEAQFHI